MAEKLKVLTLDVETTHKTKESGGTTALPYFNNRLVSIGYKWLGEDEVGYDFIHHSDERGFVDTDWFDKMQGTLNSADVIVGQNFKFDLTWLRACGFTYDGSIYDTMVAEYILAKARRWSLSLDSLAKRYGVTQKEKDLVAPYLKDGKTFYDILPNVDTSSKFVFATLFARRGMKYPDQLVYAETTFDDSYVVFPWDKLEFQNSLK